MGGPLPVVGCTPGLRRVVAVDERFAAGEILFRWDFRDLRPLTLECRRARKEGTFGFSDSPPSPENEIYPTLQWDGPEPAAVPVLAFRTRAFSKEIMNAVMDALAAHTTVSKHAIASEQVRKSLKDVLLWPCATL
jgi:hypothetical protein